MVDLETGRVLQDQLGRQQYFAEGLTDWGSTLVQLTWESARRLCLRPLQLPHAAHVFYYDGEGWGLTHDGKSLILSDGTPDPPLSRSMDIQGNPTNHGHRSRKAGHEINELEYIHGEIYANVWHSDRIARISPAHGRVLGWIDLTGLHPPEETVSTEEAVLNGIAYDAEHDRLFVTGNCGRSYSRS